MPHITVKPFDTSVLTEGKYNKTKLSFVADDLRGSDEIIGVEVEGEEFLLHLKKSKANWLLKYDKVTRPLKVNLLKQAIADISEGAKLEVLKSNISINNSSKPLASRYEKSIDDFVDIDFPFDFLSIEVGFGSGKHLLYQAQNNPNTLFIGIEIHTPSAQQVLRQIELQGLENIWVVNYDARLLLEMIDSNICNKIFVHFPVPWDKKPHRRVISASFLQESMRVLQKGGRLELRTDSYNYFWYSLDTFLGKGVSKTAIEIRKNEALEITSKYEARWNRQKKDIYDVFVTSQDNSPKRVLGFDFSFKNLRYKDEIIKKLSDKPLVYDDFFINFERVYRVSESTILLKLAFGSFDRPEHKYIWIDKNESFYFAIAPVKTVTNYRTHLKIKEKLSV